MTYADLDRIKADMASQAAEATQATPRFVREGFDHISPKSAAWLRKGIIPARGFGFLVGASQARKSFLAIDWSLRIGRGRSVIGQPGPRRSVIYVASEGASGVRNRVTAWRQANPGPSCTFDLIAEAPNLMLAADIDLLLAELGAAVVEHGAKGDVLGLIVIDTLAASMPGGDENSGKDMSALLSNVQRIGAATDAFVLVVAHTGKDEARGLRGWSGQFAGADTVIMLSREKGAALTFGEIDKQKDGEAGRRFAFGADEVVIGEDEDGAAITSLILTYEDAESAKQGRTKRDIPARLTFILDVARSLIEAGHFEAVVGVPDMPAGVKALPRAALKSELMKRGYADADENYGNVKRRLNRQIEDLVQRGLIRATETQLWLL